jgi:hypothetical protein
MVFISKEIIQRGEADNLDASIIEDYLIDALRQPADKFSRRNSLWPSGRYWADYIWPLKFLRRLEIVGYTINPEHTSAVDWKRVMSAVPRSRVVVLVRSNAIKMAFSGRSIDSICLQY